MERRENNKTKRITLRLSEDELKQIMKKCKNSTCRKLSEYIRLVLSGGPVITRTRNDSLDQLMGEIIKVRTELNHIGNNTNQATKRLHTLTQIAEFRQHLSGQNLHNEKVQKVLDDANVVINKLADQWLQ